MDAIVQLLRNGLCCVKDLDLFSDTFLYDPSLTALYYKAPSPLDKTTPLEVFISVCQFYAFLSVSVAGFRLIHQSWGKFRWLNMLIQLRSAEPGSSLADKIVDESLAKERFAVRRALISGVCCVFIGIPFFWLFANSWHVTETDWIGGMQGLINSLISMEIALLPLLWWMMADGQVLVIKSVRMVEIAEELKLNGTVKEESIDAEVYSWIVPGGWNPGWISTRTKSLQIDIVAEQKMLKDEVEQVRHTLKKLQSSNDHKSTMNDAALRLEDDAPMVRMEGYREYFYLLANFVAFYGYLLGIIAYYHHEEEMQAAYVRHLKFGLSNEDADWHGNFAGDFMWTVEPIVILTSPMLLSWVKPKARKVKSD